MIRVYYLEVERIDNRDIPKGIEYMRYGVLDIEGILRKLIQDTTDQEHDGLVAVAVSWREPTLEEISYFNENVITALPDPDYDRACELLSSSPAVISQTEMWELMRLFGKRLGYRF